MVVERFLGLKHVEDTTSNSLKKSLLQMLAKYGLVNYEDKDMMELQI